MDSNRNVFTSVDHYRHELRQLLYRAQRNLERDDGLANVALLTGHRCKQLAFVGADSDSVNAHLKSEVRRGDYESVFFIAVAAAAATGPTGGPVTVFRATSRVEDLGPPEKTALCVVVEGSHRDFGTHAAYIEFRRQGEKQFDFGKSECGPLHGGVVADLWPKRTLNS